VYPVKVADAYSLLNANAKPGALLTYKESVSARPCGIGDSLERKSNLRTSAGCGNVRGKEGGSMVEEGVSEEPGIQ
jgi:hypothetical protein